MIVKNEEKNIERALSWAKDIAYEQIVVDTGSTDRTVELAEQLGAKVYHFKWIDDFAAAKNYAINKATGDWIAILDADEFMLHEDAEKLIEVLNKVQEDEEIAEECDALSCQFINLDEKDNVISIENHQRFYRNRPYLRFKGKIHEAVVLVKKNISINDLRIFHTGYSKSAIIDKEKKERNLKMLRTEYEEDPDNPDIMHYLANVTTAIGTEKAKKEAEELHFKALRSDRTPKTMNRTLAYEFLIPRFIIQDRKDEAIMLCTQAINDLPSFIDNFYYRALLHNKKGEYTDALDDLYKCEDAILSKKANITTRILLPSQLPLFFQITVSAEGLLDKALYKKYSQAIKDTMKDNKNKEAIIGPFIRAMTWYGMPDDKVLSRLAEVYDVGNPNDLMFIARAAKESGVIEFTRNVLVLTGNLLGK